MVTLGYSQAAEGGVSGCPVLHRHIRGNAGQAVFLDDKNRRLAFLEVLTEVVERYRFVCHAY